MNNIYAPNILRRHLSIKRPNLVWVSDITYIRTCEVWLHLCVIIDLFSRKVVGYAAAETMSVDLVQSAFWKAVKIKSSKPGLLFHSDRRTQYCSKKFRNALRSQKMFQSMSRKGNCWDNACAETFFRSFKNE
jgi:putative transposase